MALTENKPNREHNEQLHFARSERLTEHRKQDCSRITRTRPGQEYAQYDFRKGEHNIILVGLFFFSSFPKCTWQGQKHSCCHFIRQVVALVAWPVVVVVVIVAS